MLDERWNFNKDKFDLSFKRLYNNKKILLTV